MKVKKNKAILATGLAIGCFLFYRGKGPEVEEQDIGLERPTVLLEVQEDVTLPNNIDPTTLELVEPIEVVVEVKAKEVELPKVSRGATEPRYQNYEATAYCGCRKCNGKWTDYPTASGTQMKAGRTIAVDPDYIPLGSRVFIEGMGEYIAEDTGSAIKGKIIDIYFDSHEEAWDFGRQQIKLKVIGGE